MGKGGDPELREWVDVRQLEAMSAPLSSVTTASSKGAEAKKLQLENEIAQKLERDAFDSKKTDTILKEHNRANVYDIKEEDFQRLKAASRKIEESKDNEDLDEFYEEIGDIDPKELIAIN